MNLKQRLAVCAGALLGAGVLSVLICPLHLPAGKVCLAASLWAACAASAGPWAADARAKSRLVRVGAAAICTGYGLLALVGGWGLARLLPENASALLLFHLLCLAGAAVFLFVLVSTAQGIRRGRELEQQFPSAWSPLFERAGACLGRARDEERPPLERLCAALRKAEEEGKDALENEFADLLEQLEETMKKPAGPQRADQLKNLCEEACWLAGLTGPDPKEE